MFDIRSYLARNHFLATIVFLLIGWFFLQIKSILLLFFICIIIVSTLAPAVRYLRKYKVPKIIAIALVYIVLIAFLSLLIAPLIPFFIAQFQSLLENFPRYIDQTARILHVRIETQQVNNFISSQLTAIGDNAVAVTSGILGGFLSLVTILVISFYLLLDHDNIKEKLPLLFPKSLRPRVNESFQEIEVQLGAWFRGQLVLSIAVGLFTWIALSIIGLPYALPLAVMAGMLEIIPTIGPIISAIPAIIVGFSISPPTALIVTGAFLLIQQIENNLLVPKIMATAVGLHPVVVILGVIIGGQMAGVLGALLSVPFISVLYILFRNSQE